MKCLRKIFNNPTNTLMKNMKVNLKQLISLTFATLLALQGSSEGFSSGTSSGRRLRAPNMRRKTTQGGVSGFAERSSQTDDFSSNASQTSKKSTIKSTGGSSLLPESFDVEQDDVKQSKSALQKVLSAEGLAVKDELKVEFGEGHGETTDEALKEAMRDVLQKVVGVYVDSDFRMNNDEIIRDEIITYSNGFIDHYKKMDEEDDKNGRGKVVTIKAWVKMRDFVNRMKKIAPSQTVKVDGVLLDNELGNKLNAEALLRKEFENFDPVMDWMEINLVDSIRPEIQSSQDGAVVLRYVYVIRYSKEKYYKKFLPRVNTLFNQISTGKPIDRSERYRVEKMEIFPCNWSVYSEPWKVHSVLGFFLEEMQRQDTGRPCFIDDIKKLGIVSIAQNITRGGVISIREWRMSEHLAEVYYKIVEQAYERVERRSNCVFSLLDAKGNHLSEAVQKIDFHLLFENSCEVDVVPLMAAPITIFGGRIGRVDRHVGFIDIVVDKDDISKIKSAEIKLETTNKGE